MENEMKQRIESFGAIVLAEVNPREDILSAPLVYLMGDFSIASLPQYETLGQLLDAINPHAEVSIGIGYDTYRRSIVKDIESCKENGTQASFMLPLWDGVSTHNFLAKVIQHEGKIGLLFFYYDDSGVASDMDDMLANNFKDHLTGLFNRRTMIKHVSANRRAGYLCLFDLNKFKAINDNFGHERGDEVLLHISRFLIQNSTDNEVFYRRSGDEFMMLVFRHEKDYVDALVQRIQDYLQAFPSVEMPHCPGLVCGASFGILELLYLQDEEALDYETELQLVDLAMYQAKYAGKLSHYISHEDAMNIVEAGNLAERLSAIAKKISR